MLCVDCKYGHECPYMKTDDMEHALIVEGDEEVDVLMGKVRKLLEQLKARVKEAFGVSVEFDFCIDLNECQGYEEGFKVSWDDEDSETMDVLVTELYRLAGDCRSKVGVRLPFDLFDTVLGVLERCRFVAVGPAKVNEN